MRRLVWPLLLSLALVLAACGEDDGELSVEDLPDGTEESDTDEDAEDEAPDPDTDTGDEGEDTGESGDDESEEDGGGSEDTEDEGDDEPAPEPDPEAVEDPCSGREGADAFLDVVAPVEGQEVADELELVGCANVPEGTVRYRLTADDEALLDSHTTAECGGPCIGEYRTTIDLGEVEATGEATLEVFWDSPAGDGGEEDRSEIGIVLE